MNRKAVFAFAGVFLTIALVAPRVISILQADPELTTPRLRELVALIEVIFAILFVITLHYGLTDIKHIARSKFTSLRRSNFA